MVVTGGRLLWLLYFEDLLPFSHCLAFRGRFTKSQEDPKRTEQPFRRSLSWTSVKNYLSVELSQLSARGNAEQNARSYRDYPLSDLPPFLSDLSLELGSS